MTRHAKRLAELLAERDHVRRKVRDEEARLQEAREELLSREEARKILQGVAEAVQQQAHSRIADLVTHCLKAVFGDDAPTFRIDFSQKRGRTEAELVFVRDGHSVESPTDSDSGGVIDVAAFALRLACLTLSTPRRRKLLVLDEPMKNVNGQAYQDRVGRLILTLAERTGVQFVIVTDDDWLKVGNVIELE